MRTTLSLSLVLAAACAGKPAAPAAPDADADGPFASLATEVEATLDRSVSPCDDFYAFACGGWMDSTELPSDRPIFGRGFSTIADRNQQIVREILDAAASGEADADPRLGAYYGACIDTEAIDAAGDEVLKQSVAEMVAANDLAELMTVVAAYPRNGAFFGGGVFPDFLDPDTNMFHLAQGGTALPERSYYFPEDDDGKALLVDYQAHVKAAMELGGWPATDGHAATVLAIETALAEASRPPAEMRDPTTLYHPTTRAELAEAAPNVPWDALFAAVGLEVDTVNVMTPEFLPALDAVLTGHSLDELREYAIWHQITAYAGFGSKALDDENFAFFGTRLNGTKDQQPRWKRCVNRTDGAIGDLLGQAFVNRAFAGESKDKALAMVRDITTAFEAGLPGLEWMDDATRAAAKAKLDAISNKIGYPDTWETFEGLEVGDDHMSNVIAVDRWALADAIAKVGQPVDKTEWAMSPPTVNAYYNPFNNEIVFPAGILQPPFFSAAFPTAMNYGAMGMVIGHEITHGFDDSGRKFGPTGKMEAWWDDAVATRFEAEAQCIDDTYAAIEVQPGVSLNGKLTLGENIADFGGIKLAAAAYAAYRDAGGQDPVVAGFTPEQLLYVGYAQSWCTIATPEIEVQRAKTDSHSPPKYRVNVPLAAQPAFWDAFGCDVGTPMHPETVCSVW